MSTVIPVAADWLELREGADARARSAALARAAARRLPRGAVVVHDLGGGTGAMTRWLAPRLPGPQTWVLHDWNAELLAPATSAPAPRDAAGGPVEVLGRVGALGALRAEHLAGASLVTASALLDVLSRAELEAIVATCLAARAPVLLSLSVTGRVELVPPDPSDRVFEAAFDDHQRRTVDGRRLLGPDAVEVAAALFARAGWRVRLADTPWRLDVADAGLEREWLEGWLGAAVEQRPALREWADEVHRVRSAQLAAGALRVTVHHRDLLASPR